MSGQRIKRRDHKWPTISDMPGGYLFLSFASISLLLGFVLFAILPSTVEIASYKTAVLSTLFGLTLAAVVNLVINLIQTQAGRVASHAMEEILSKPLDQLSLSVSRLQRLHLISEQGIQGIFANRTAAMQHFHGEIEREDTWIGFVGTSLLGILDPSEQDEQKQKLLEMLIKKRDNGVRINALLMHPAYGEFRERVENRGLAAVATDIQKTLRTFVSKPVPTTEASSQKEVSAVITGDGAQSETEINRGSQVHGKRPLFEIRDVRLYTGVITAFTIFTKHSMLVNVSTLTGKVFENLTLIVRDTDDPNSIYKKFKASHFDTPWGSEQTIGLDYDKLQELLKINFANSENRFKEGSWPATIENEWDRVHKVP